MGNTGKYFSIITLCFTLAACSGTKSPQVASLKAGDKQLSCSQVQLEINEAEFYRKQALDNKSPGFGSVVSPLSYISTYVNAGKAQVAADDRIDYLNRIYEINRCDEQQLYVDNNRQQNPFAPPAELAAYGSQPAPFQPVPVVTQPQYGYYQQPQQYAPAGQYAYASPIAYQPNNSYYYTY